MAPISVPVFFREVLHSVCQQFSLDPPFYGNVEEKEDGMYRKYIEIEYFDAEGDYEFIKCMGARCESAEQAEEDAAHEVLKKLRGEFSFEVKDYNFEEKKYFENLYTRVSKERRVIRQKFKRLKTEHNLLRRYYVALLTDKERRTVAPKKSKHPSAASASHEKIGPTNLSDVPPVPPGFDN